MIDVEQLKRQHAEIDEVMTGAMGVIDAGEVSSKATVLAAMLADISRLIGSHLAIEDRKCTRSSSKAWMIRTSAGPHSNSVTT